MLRGNQGRGTFLSFSGAFAVLAMLVGALLISPAHADGVDVDFDAALKLMDGVQQALDDAKPEVGPGDLIKLFGQDRDANGILDEDQLAMLAAILMGQYTLDGTIYGTDELTPSIVSAIQAGFVANKSRVNTDLTLDNTNLGSPCFLLQLAGQSCNMGDLIAQGNADTKDGLLSLLAAYYTLGEAGVVNYNGSGEDFVETYFERLIEIGLRGTEFATYTNAIKSDLSFNPNNYQKFGNAGANNYLGAAGNIDSNLGNATTNLDEYNATADREEWLNACHITPPLRVVTSPDDATKNTGDSHSLVVTIAGGVDALGLPGTQSKWSTVVTVDAVTTVTEVRPLQANLAYDFPYLTLPVGQPSAATNYIASVEDGVWKRASETAVLTVNLDTNFRITAQPVGGEYAAGESVTLSVGVAGGNALPGYQWTLDGGIIDGATGSSYTFPAAAGTYRCVINGNTDGAAKAAIQLETEPAVISTPAEGAVDGEGVVEGIVEGIAEGVIEGEGLSEGIIEGVIEGEGLSEGITEGVIEGEGIAEGITEGQLEGEGVSEGITEGLIEGEGIAEGITEGQPEGEGVSEGITEGAVDGEGLSEGEGLVEGVLEGSLDGEGLAEGEGVQEGLEEGEGGVEIPLCTVGLTPGQVAPASSANASGVMNIYDREDGSRLYLIEHTVEDPIGAVIRIGDTCENGADARGIGNAESPISIILDPSEVAFVDGLAEPLYIIVWSNAHPDGAIRGVFGCPPFPQDSVLCSIPEGEGNPEGGLEGEGIVEGEGEALTLEALAERVLLAYLNYNGDGNVSVDEVKQGNADASIELVEQLDINGDDHIQVSELLALVGGGFVHAADQDADGDAGLDELLRVIQFFNAGQYVCAENAGASEDGYLPAEAESGRDLGCLVHSSDYEPEGGDGVISLSELLRLIQIYNIGSYAWCPGEFEDGYCAGSAK